MQTIGGNYSEIISGPYKVDTHFIIGGTTYTQADVKSASINGTLFDELGIGNAMTRELRLVLKGMPEIPRGATIQVQQQVFNATYPLDWTNTSQRISKGTFFISRRKVNRKANTTEIIAYDAMNKMDVPYMESGEWASTSAANVVSQICTDVGIPLDARTLAALTSREYIISSPPVMGENGTTRREMLQQIGVLYAGNWTIADNGSLTLIPLKQSGTPTVVGDKAGSCINQAALPAIDAVKLVNGSSVFKSAGFDSHTGTALICDSNYASDENADIILSNTSGYVYQPYTAERAYIEPAAGLGDLITIYGLTSVIARQSITISRTCPSNVGADHEAEEEDEYKYVPPVQREIVRNEDKAQASIKLTDEQIRSDVSSQIAIASNDLSTNITDAKNELQREIDTTNGKVATLTTRTSSLEQTASAFQATLSTKITQADADAAAQAAASELAATLETYIRYYQSGGTGVLELGDNQSGYTAKLNNQKLSFYDGQNEVAYISNNKLYIRNSEITGDLQIGKYQWITDSTGRMSLKWVG